MTSDWLLLLVGSIVVVALIARELRRGETRNMVGLMLFVGLLVIVVGQQWYILTMLEDRRAVYVFENLITRDGFHLASMWLVGSVIVMAISYVYGNSVYPSSRSARPVGWPDTIDSSVAAGLISGAGFVMLCITHSGVLSQLTQLGSNTGGLVLALGLVGFAKYPYIHKLAYGRKPARRDLVLVIAACLLMMINSRGFALTIVLQILVITAYRGQVNTTRLLVRYAVISVAIVVLYGSVRDFAQWRYASGAVDIADVYRLDAIEQYLRERQYDFLWLFYEHSVGVFSGFAGILSFYLVHGIQHDFGVSILALFPHLTPYSVRTGLLRNLDEWLRNIYPYKGSVVPGGFEASFAHFGFGGVLVYSLGLGLAPAVIHRKVQAPGGDLLKWGLLAPYLFTFVMCDISMVGFFVIVELVSLGMFRGILEASARRVVRGEIAYSRRNRRFARSAV